MALVLAAVLVVGIGVHDAAARLTPPNPDVTIENGTFSINVGG